MDNLQFTIFQLAMNNGQLIDNGQLFILKYPNNRGLIVNYKLSIVKSLAVNC